MNFCSDNTTGVAPAILAALAAANEGRAMPYGEDAATRRFEAKMRELFETDLAAFAVMTGSAANALALACLAPPYGAIYCHAGAHINEDECGGPEFQSGGAKLVGLTGEHGKLDPRTLSEAFKHAGKGDVHRVQPAVVSITQASEAGTVYARQEIAAIAAVAHEAGCALHMDGARFANALVHLGCSPAEATWKAGVDALSFGATKNGALAAEAVILFDRTRAAEFAFRRKRSGHLLSKMRFVSAQLEAYVTDGLWLALARHANRCAAELADGLAAIPGVELRHKVEANEVFVTLPEPALVGLESAGFRFYRWHQGPAGTVRLVAGFDTRPEHVREFVDTARRFCREASRTT
jgi:threonine aldolase